MPTIDRHGARLPRTFEKHPTVETSSPKDSLAGDSVRIIVESFDLPWEVVRNVAGYTKYGERGLNQLLAPDRQGPTVVVTAAPLENGTLECLQISGEQMRGRDADKRVTFQSTHQTGADSYTWLCKYLLEHPDFLERLRDLTRAAKERVLSFYNSHDLIGALGEALSARLDGLDPQYQSWGTKTGNRKAFALAKIVHPPGVTGQIRTLADLIEGPEPKPRYGLAQLMADYPDHDKVMLKLDDGLSGDGNSRIFLEPLRELIQGRKTREERIQTLNRVFSELVEDIAVESHPGPDGRKHEQRVHVATYQGEKIVKLDGAQMKWSTFVKELKEQGGIAELFVKGVADGSPSPSGQGFIHEDGSVEFLSHHLQILAPGGIYLGCKLPSSPAMYTQIRESVEALGKVYAAKGVRGRFTIDFVATPRLGEDGQPILFLDSTGQPVPRLGEDGAPMIRENGAVEYEVQWDLHAIESDLRVGGTSHPFQELKNLGGEWDAQGRWIVDGQEKCYVAMDNIINRSLRWLKAEDVIDIARRNELLFDPKKKVGVRLFLLGLAGNHGKLGATCIANSPKEAHELLKRFEAAVEAECGRRGKVLPAAQEMGVETGRGNASDPLFRGRVEREIAEARVTQLGNGPTDYIRDVAYSPDGTWVATARNLPETSELVLLPVGKTLDPMYMDTKGIQSIRTLAASDDQLVLATPESQIVALDPITGSKLWSTQLPSDSGLVNRMTYSPAEAVIAVGLSDGSVRFLDQMTGAEIPRLKIDGAKGWVRSQCYSPDGKLFAVGDDGGVIRVFRTKDPQRSPELFQLNAPVNSLAISPDKKLAAVTSRHELYVINLKTNEVVGHISHEWPLGEVTFSPSRDSEGKPYRGTVMAMGQNSKLVMYDTDTLASVSVLDADDEGGSQIAHERTVGSAHFSEEGHIRLLSNTGSLKEVLLKPLVAVHG